MPFLHGPSFESMHCFLRIVSGAGYILDTERIRLVFATSIKSVQGNSTKYVWQSLDRRGQRAYPFDGQKREVPHALSGEFLRSVSSGNVAHFVSYYSR